MLQRKNFGTMRHLILILSLILVGCKTNKNIVANSEVNTDSISHKSEYRTITGIDSTLTNNTFDFDTLSITVTRPAETISIRAVKGRVSKDTKEVRKAIDGYGRLDSVAYKNTASSHSADKSETAKWFTPPSGTAVSFLIVALIAILWFLFLRKL